MQMVFGEGEARASRELEADLIYYVRRTGRPVSGPLMKAFRWAALPYGQWTCEDGREVLFTRRREPLWQRYPGQPATPANPDEWVRGIVARHHFYDDQTPESAKRAAGIAALAAWGLPTPAARDAVGRGAPRRPLTAPECIR
jgi:hypothetical protein